MKSKISGHAPSELLHFCSREIVLGDRPLDHDEITRLAEELGSRADAGSEELIAIVYDELKELSRAYLSRERTDHTLQPTALVHEAYLALSRSSAPWSDEAHFFRTAARVMRHILINHALAARAQKRGGGSRGVPLVEAVTDDNATPFPAMDVVDLSDALDALAEIDQLNAQVVELRFFGGCTIAQTADTLGLSTASVERRWRFARAWLRSRLEESAPQDRAGRGDHR